MDTTKKSFKVRFSEDQKRRIIRDYLDSDLSKADIWEKYTGSRVHHNQLLSWMRRLGYNDKFSGGINYLSEKDFMKRNTDRDGGNSRAINARVENAELKRRILELEKLLEDAEGKADAYSTLIDIVERDYKVPVRKKLNTKPSKK